MGSALSTRPCRLPANPARVKPARAQEPHPARVSYRMRAAGNVSHMTDTVLPGRLGKVRMDGELPNREDLGLVFDELDYQLATQAYLWALPLVSFTPWRQQHRE